jgi:putative glutamine amidotransferase
LKEFEHLNFFIFDGGADVHPRLYGEIKEDRTFVNEYRDFVEINTYATMEALFPDINFVGICRGHQFLNVMRGGTLFQDLGKINKPHPALHSVNIVNKESLLYKYVNAPKMWVNSAHHQAIKVLGEGLISTMVDSKHNIIEGIEGDKIRAVQSHPEMWTRDYSHVNEVLSYLFRRNE